MITIGLPEMQIAFRSKAASAIRRSQNGIVVLIIKDESTTEVLSYKGVEDVTSDFYNEKNTDYINKVFLGTPSKVIVVNIGTAGVIADGLNLIKNLRFNYLAVPFADAEDSTAVASFVKSQRENKKKTFKAVLANNVADDEGVINFTAEEIKVGNKDYTTAEYTARVAGAALNVFFLFSR